MPPLETPPPTVRRSYRGSCTPTTGGGSYDHGGYDSWDDDNDRTCLSPPGAQVEYYQEYAHAAGEPNDDEYKTTMPEVGDDGKLKSLSSTAMASFRFPQRLSTVRLNTRLPDTLTR